MCKARGQNPHSYNPVTKSLTSRVTSRKKKGGGELIVPVATSTSSCCSFVRPRLQTTSSGLLCPNWSTGCSGQRTGGMGVLVNIGGYFIFYRDILQCWSVPNPLSSTLMFIFEKYLYVNFYCLMNWSNMRKTIHPYK